jgi:hypothetical protein
MRGEASEFYRVVIMGVLDQDEIPNAQAMRALEQADDGRDDSRYARTTKRALIAKTSDHIY